ncbi:MAG TPA: tetratricopeptide repeat protein [Gemmatimonadaceae bacterium]
MATSRTCVCQLALAPAVLLCIAAGSSAYAQSPRSIAAALQSGDSAYAAGARSQAIAAYRDVVRLDSSRSSRAIYRLAVLLAEEGEYSEAITLHKAYNRLEPNDKEGVIGLARTYSWAGRSDDAVALYRSVLAAEPDYRDAALGAGQVLAWSGRYAESVETYRAWLRHRAGDRQAAMALARTLAWWGGSHLHDAARMYDSLYAVDRDVEARKGLALVKAWQGDLVGSERLWRELSGTSPNDPEVWTGLAQVLRWRGRPFDARDALERALIADPRHRDAQSQRRWLDAELAPMLHARVLSTGDSDGNRAQFYVVNGAAQPWRRVALRFDAVELRATDGSFDRTSRTARGSAAIRLPIGSDDWTARAELGANQQPGVSARGAARSSPLGGVALAKRFGDRSSAEVRVGRAMLDETVALIANGVRTTTTEADWESQISDHLSVSASLGSGRVSTDTTSNARFVGVFGMRWALAHGRSFGIVARSVQHAKEARDGYFSPRRYEHLELTARARHGRELGWVFTGDAGFGVQRVDYRGARTTQPSQRLTGSVGYTWSPGLEWTLTGALANVATTATLSTSSYRFGSLSLGGRVPLR